MLPSSRPLLARRLFVLGFQLLFLELALIRFLPGFIWNLGYFPNLVLLAAFIGFGFGFLLHRRLDEARSTAIYQALPLALVGFLLLVIWLRPQALVAEASSGTTIAGELYWTANLNQEPDSLGVQALKFMLWFGGVVVIFYMLGQYMAKYFAKLRPLHAYSLDIAGSLLGIVSFMAISYFQIGAWLWFLIFTASFTYVVWQKGVIVRERVKRKRRTASFTHVIWQKGVGKKFAALGVVFCLAFSLLTWILDNPELVRYRMGVPHEIAKYIANASNDSNTTTKSEWSPYQRVTSLTNNLSGTIYTNGINHQYYDGSVPFQKYYFLPHSLAHQSGIRPFEKVMVIGAGSGNDVFAAISNGAKRVVAVEIDPTISQYGYKSRYLRGEKQVRGPYHSPLVELVIDDGRHHLYTTDEKFDLIILALTDSLVKVSPVTQLRLENYLFTDASFKRAAELLRPGGWLVLYNYYRENWLVDRYQKMMEEAMPEGSAVLAAKVSSWAVIAGINPGGERDKIKISSPVSSYDGVLPTDDWPFPYVKERQLAPQYLLAMLFMLAVVGIAFALARSAGDGRRVNPWFALSFMMMGSAFLLLETKGIIQFSLLFGTTWYNSSFVFFGVLSLILVAIRVANKVRSPRLLPVSAALLIVSALITLALPLELLLGFSGPVRFTLACLLLFMPIFFANLVFSALFRDRDDAELYFGWNLLGATLGGVLEYLSVVVGYQALGWVVIACYGVALASAWKAQKTKA